MGDPIYSLGAAVGSPPGSQPMPGMPSSPAKQLTAAIKSCTSLERLAQLYQAHQAVLNPIHVAALITRLPKLDVGQSPSGLSSAEMGSWGLLPAGPAVQQQAQLRQLLQQLLSRLQLQGCSDHSPRGVANIVWALAKLQCAPDGQLWAMLLDRFCQQLSSAVPQDISNILWGVAKLTKERAPVLNAASGGPQQQPAASAAAEGMGLSASPGSLQAGGTAAGRLDLSSAAAAGAGGPLLQQEQVRVLLQHLSKQLHSASVQTISNSLWAVVVLQQEHQWCMCNCLADVQTLLAAFCAQPQQALPGHIQPIIRCMAQLASTCSSHAGEAWLQWQPPLLQRLLDYLVSERDQLEMHHVSSVLRDVAQIVCLQLQLQKQARDQQQRAAGGSGIATPSGFSSTSSLPSMSEGLVGAAAGLEGELTGRISYGGGGGAAAGAASSTASTSSTLSASVAVQSVPASTASGEDAEDVLARLAASGGPQDASSTVLALAMLRPQLQQLGLQPGIASLCSLLPPAALPHLGPDVAPRLLAAASLADSSSACSPTAVPQAEKAGQGGDDFLPGRFLLPPISGTFAARVFAQSGEGLPLVPVPLAVPGSVGSSSGSSIASPTAPSPLASQFGGGGSPTTGGLPQPGVDVGALGVGFPAALGGSPGPSNTATVQHNPHGNPGSPQLTGTHNPGSPGQRQAGSGSAAAPAGPGGDPTGAADSEAEAAGDSQEEAAARQLTHNIAYADSVFQLADIFTAHASVMDMIHITACITRLSKVLGTSPSQASQAAAASLLPLLGNKLLSVLPHANARGIANVLWGYGRLRALPQVQLLPPLVEAFLLQLPNAACRDSAVVLWSLARLSEGHGEPAEPTLPPALLQRLGHAVLQQLATAAQEAPSPRAAQRQQQQQQQPAQQPPGAPSGDAAGERGKAAEGGGAEDAAGGPPSSRDVSNSLMALARLGFLPEDDTTPGAAGQQGAEQSGSSSVVGQLQGLSLAGAAAAAATATPKQLTLPLSLIKAVVEYLLRMAATAKTLDLQETATALKQLGLRELHARVAATVVLHHGTTHSSGGGAFGVPFMQFGGPASRMGQARGGRGVQQGHLHQQGQAQFGMVQQYPGMLQPQRRQQGLPGAMFGGGGWVPAHQGVGGQFDGGAALRQQGPAGYMGPRPDPARQVLRQPGMVQQPQQQAYVLSPADALPSSGGRHSMTGYTSLAAASAGMSALQMGGSPAGLSPAAPAYGIRYGEPQPQQQQQAGGLYPPAMQYMLMPQQQARAGVVAHGQQQGGEFLGVPVLQQQQAGGDQAPPGLLGGSPGQQYYLAAPGTQGLVMPGLGSAEAQATAEGQQQLFLQPLQQAQAAARAGLGGMGQFGGYQPGSGPLVPDAMTSTAYTPAVVGDIFLTGQQQQQQPQAQRSQLQMLQQQMQPVGLYQQQQGLQGQDPGALYLHQAQQQQQQLPVMMYGLAGQPQQQFGGQQPGTFVLDPTTGMYIQQ